MQVSRCQKAVIRNFVALALVFAALSLFAAVNASPAAPRVATGVSVTAGVTPFDDPNDSNGWE
jgi:hypothetical protein